MAFQFSTSARNGALDAIETAIGVSAVLKLRTGSAPANCGTADSGTVVATMTLPSDWLAAASAGAKAKSGTWQDTSADADGTVGHFRIYASDGTTCHIQGTVSTVAAGTGDMQLDNTAVLTGQSITISSFSISAGGA